MELIDFLTICVKSPSITHDKFDTDKNFDKDKNLETKENLDTDKNFVIGYLQHRENLEKQKFYMDKNLNTDKNFDKDKNLDTDKNLEKAKTETQTQKKLKILHEQKLANRQQ